MPATTSETERTVEGQFVDLIYGDTDVLAAEFAAIIAEEWPERPAGIPGRTPDGGTTGSGPPRHPTPFLRGTGLRPRHPGIGGWGRQRSPPSPQPTHDTSEGR